MTVDEMIQELQSLSELGRGTQQVVHYELGYDGIKPAEIQLRENEVYLK